MAIAFAHYPLVLAFPFVEATNFLVDVLEDGVHRTLSECPSQVLPVLVNDGAEGRD